MNDSGAIAARSELLNRLLTGDENTETLVARLATFGWDSDVELAVLTRHHVSRILIRFSAGNLSANEVETWAEAIEGRDDIGLERGHEGSLKQIIFEMAGPSISGELSTVRAGEWLAALG
jgi:hypothetical protein